MSIEQNSFNNLITQIETTHKTLQMQSIQSVSSSLTIRNWLIGYYIVEYDLEEALLNHLQDFLLELGNGFCFEARQKRISIENENEHEHEHDRIDFR